jgi:hypothetical protein
MGVIRPTSGEPIIVTQKEPWLELSELRSNTVETPSMVSWVEVSCTLAKSMLRKSFQSNGKDVILQGRRKHESKGIRGELWRQHYRLQGPCKTQALKGCMQGGGIKREKGGGG